jgi:hypothetical protein
LRFAALDQTGNLSGHRRQEPQDRCRSGRQQLHAVRDRSERRHHPELVEGIELRQRQESRHFGTPVVQLGQGSTTLRRRRVCLLSFLPHSTTPSLRLTSPSVETTASIARFTG